MNSKTWSFEEIDLWIFVSLDFLNCYPLCVCYEYLRQQDRHCALTIIDNLWEVIKNKVDVGFFRTLKLEGKKVFDESKIRNSSRVHQKIEFFWCFFEILWTKSSENIKSRFKASCAVWNSIVRFFEEVKGNGEWEWVKS